jgi:hypothetical protein
VVALLAAVAMIAGALVYRSHRDHTASTASLRIVCASELAAACDAVSSIAHTTVEPARVTEDRLTKLADGADPGLDAWLVPGLWPQMADEERATGLGAQKPLFRDGEDLASSHVGVAVFPDRKAVLDKACGGATTWKCLGDVAAKQTWKAVGGPDAWGPVKYAIDDPPTTASGLAALGGLASGYFGRDGLIPSRDDDTFRDWLHAFTSAVRPAVSVQSMAAAGPAIADAAVAVEALAQPSLGANTHQLTLVYPQPVPVLSVQLAIARRGSDIRSDLVAPIRRSLLTAGWSAPGKTYFPTSVGLTVLLGFWAEAKA